MPNPSSIYQLSTHELPRRAGEMKEYQLDLELLEKVGTELIAVQVGDVIEVDARCEAVEEGILLTARIMATATGECSRCLDPVVREIDRTIQELYHYEKTPVRGKKKAREDEDIDLDDDDELQMDGEIMNLELPIRDAIILDLPINPLCDPECQGLCPECGEKWANLPEDHAHEVIDARWAGLSELKEVLKPSQEG